MWQAVRTAILEVLDNTTIADLAERERAAQSGGTRYVI
jgi:DNA-binding IscR family transcriptional regulator